MEEQAKDSPADESKNSSKEKSKDLTEDQPDNSADDSPIGSHSTTPNSTSTYEWSHEPFLSFQHKIVELAGQMGASKISDVMRLTGGSSNRVISATVCCGDESAPQIRGVFRIPRFTIWQDDEKAATEPYELDRRIYEQVAMSSFLAAHGVPAPRILAFDATSANAINSPYTFQELASGTRLDELYPSMALEEKLSIVDGVVDVLASLESIKFSEAGRIDYVKQPPNSQSMLPCKAGFLDYVSSGNPTAGFEISGFGTGGDPGEPRDPTRTTRFLLDMLKEQLDAWITYEIEKAPGPPEFTTDMFRRLQSVVQEMETLGFFESSVAQHGGEPEPQNILYHFDLEARNILVAPIPGSGQTGLATDLGSKTACRLWKYSELYGETDNSMTCVYDGDVDLLSADRYGEGSGRLSEDDCRIKSHFEESFVRKLSTQKSNIDMAVYQDEAYGRGPWLRRLARFAIDGFSDSADVKRFDRFVEEWDRARPTFQTSRI
ncbi:hypothetical protein GJ744_009269 [Endocarpon pusillum]|uniref:Aminoglycoside phosphotransferase domain-containing protein n=1 Tax=Endocarpon pusillum TaxID=364733 RepID=A0A8H7AJZ3_9EURO|nr:hypothetical protein GJ744_009269 [Endocarpon pusillum]